MAYFIRYNLEFINNLGDTCLLEIYKDDVEVLSIDLDGSAQPVVQRGIDNSRELYTPIRGQELVAEIVTNTLSITDFIADDETTWKGIFKVNGNTVFEGFLLQEDSQEEFVSYLHVIRLKFTDGLGLLKGQELRDDNEVYWFEVTTFYDIIKKCLNKTGLILPINIFCNIFPADTADITDESAFSISKMYTKSFQKNQRDFIDCYEVLSQVMKAWGCTVYQYRGEWVVDRIADRHEQSTSYFNYATDDTVTLLSTSHYGLSIGESQDIKEVENPLLFSVGRASKENKITYRFENWVELIRNLDLDEGTYSAPNSGAGYSAYTLDYWTQTSRTAYIIKDFDSLGNETQRYVSITGATNNLDLDKYIKTGTFPALAGDKIKFSFSASTKTDLTSTHATVYVKCGSYYLDDDGTWTTSAVFLRLDWAAAENTTEWKSYEIESDEIKADGDLEIRFLLISGCTTGNSTRYKDISIAYLPIIGNSQSAKGDFNNFTNSVTTKNPIDETVTISDSQEKIFKGAIFKNNGTTLESGWQRGANSEAYRFSQLNALGYYQSSYRSKHKLDGTFRGTHFDTLILGADLYPVGSWVQYSFDDIPDKIFYLTSLDEIDWFTGVWRGSFIEVNDSVLDTDITDVPNTYIYNYIFE